jgi:hypothetical protein
MDVVVDRWVYLGICSFNQRSTSYRLLHGLGPVKFLCSFSEYARVEESESEQRRARDK